MEICFGMGHLSSRLRYRDKNTSTPRTGIYASANTRFTPIKTNNQFILEVGIGSVTPKGKKEVYKMNEFILVLHQQWSIKKQYLFS